MKKLLITFLFFAAVFISCETDPMPEFEEIEFVTIEVKVNYLDSISADPLPLTDLDVGLYISREDAELAEDPFRIAQTTESGWVKFFDIPFGFNYYVRAELEDHGVYIDEISANNSNVIDIKKGIIFIKDRIYDHNNTSISINPISLSEMEVGQESFYSYGRIFGQLNFNIPEEEITRLRVRIINDNLEGKFLVRERLDGFLSSTQFQNYLSFSTTNIWQVKNDSLFISPESPGGLLYSFLWNISDVDEIYTEYVAFPLTIPTENQIDLDTHLPDDSWFGTGYVDEYTLESKSYENLIVHKRRDESTQVPIKYLVYDQTKGIIRSVQFLDQSSSQSEGFHLIDY